MLYYYNQQKINRMCKLSYMIHEKYLRLFVIPLMVLISMSWGQFVDVNVTLDMRRLNEVERQLFNTMSSDIKNYFLGTQFSLDVTDLEMIIDIRLVLESISHGGSQTNINAQAIFSNKMDQYFYAKGVQFPYSRSRKMYYSVSFDPLASFLDYYALMFIATELDTWDYMGGTSFFNRAVELADMGKDSDWPQGWDDRWKKARKIKNNQYLRSMRFNYFAAWFAYNNTEELDIKIIKESMHTFYNNLNDIDEKLGSNKETLKFLETYHVNIAELLAASKIMGGLELLRLYDHDHKKVYESYLKN